MTPRTAEAARVEQANQAFYDAVERSDLDALEELVLTGPLAETVSVVHPGWPVLRGRREVMRSYALIMANTEYIQFFLTDVDVVMLPRGADEPDTAVIVCTENILSGEGMSSPDAFAGGRAVCTSIVVRTGGGWKFWSRHASPIAELMQEDD